MQRYKFRLEAVLKVRTMHEETCRSALGLLMVERQNLVEVIQTLRHDIQSAYTEQETHLVGGLKASHVAFFPQSISGKEARIKQIEGEIAELDKRIEAKRLELTQLRAELKLVENLRQKDFDKWRKAYNKETDMKVEEMVQLWDENRKSQGDIG